MSGAGAIEPIMGFVRPRFDEIAHAVAPYFASRRPWTHRHVETVRLRSASRARRTLTIDVVLPYGRERSHPSPDGRRLFHVPATMISKSSLTSLIDLTDEAGSSLPLLNRTEHGAISAVALCIAAERILGGRLPPELKAALRAVCSDSEVEAGVGMAVALIRMPLIDFPGCEERPGWVHLASLIRDLSANSVIWVPLEGLAGERRVVQFAYDIDVESPPIPRPRRKVKTVELEVGSRTYLLEVVKGDDGDSTSSLRRVANRVATAFGLAAYETDIESPSIFRTRSYHLQVIAPENLETRGLRLQARLMRDGSRLWPTRKVTRSVAHLHFERAEVTRKGPAIASLRVGRRGFLTHGLVATALIAAMLWLFATNYRPSRSGTSDEITAAILLLVPALLTAFVVRPGEHALVARLVSGIRLLVLTSGLLSVAAACALVSVQPSWLDQDDLLRYCAIGATAVVGVLMLSWLLSLDVVERLRRGAEVVLRGYGRYAVIAAAALFAAEIAAWVVVREQGAFGVRQGIEGGVLALIGIGLVWIALFSSETRRPRYSQAMSGPLWVGAFVAFAGTVPCGGVDVRVMTESQAQMVVRIALALALLGVGVVELLRRARVPVGAELEDEDLRPSKGGGGGRLS